MKKGQTLTMLLVFIGVIITVLTAVIMINVINISNSRKIEQGNIAYNIAESGIENALLRLLRDPTYQGETLPVGNGTAEISINGSSLINILSIGKVGTNIKKIQVQVNTDDTLTIVSWKEIQ
jgi:hypothetical protein